MCEEIFGFHNLGGANGIWWTEARDVATHLKFDLTAHNSPLAQMPLALAEKECRARDKEDPAGLTRAKSMLGWLLQGRLSSGQSLFH